MSPYQRTARKLLRVVSPSAFLFVGAITGAGLLYRVWRGLGVAPLDANGDQWLHIMYIRNLQNGNLNDNPLLGAPFGQHLLDFPTGNEFLHLVM